MLEARLGVGETQYTKIRSLKACPNHRESLRNVTGWGWGFLYKLI